jgi:hypothetical protein
VQPGHYNVEIPIYRGGHKCLAVSVGGGAERACDLDLLSKSGEPCIPFLGRLMLVINLKVAVNAATLANRRNALTKVYQCVSGTDDQPKQPYTFIKDVDRCVGVLQGVKDSAKLNHFPAHRTCYLVGGECVCYCDGVRSQVTRPTTRLQ